MKAHQAPNNPTALVLCKPSGSDNTGTRYLHCYWSSTHGSRWGPRATWRFLLVSHEQKSLHLSHCFPPHRASWDCRKRRAYAVFPEINQGEFVFIGEPSWEHHESTCSKHNQLPSNHRLTTRQPCDLYKTSASGRIMKYYEQLNAIECNWGRGLQAHHPGKPWPVETVEAVETSDSMQPLREYHGVPSDGILRFIYIYIIIIYLYYGPSW